MELKKILSAGMDNIWDLKVWISHINPIQGMRQRNVSMVWDFCGYSVPIALPYNG